jgi:putative peptidoglycan lipid II flippase
MSKTAKAALWIMIATLFSKILGFIREIVLANYYGTGLYADVFLLTLNIPGLIITIVGSAIATSYVPLYFDIKEKLGEKETDKFTNNMLNLSLVISLIIAIFGFIFAKEVVKIFAGGFEGEKFILAVNFTKIMIFGVIFLSATKLFTVYLQVNDNFTIPALIGIPYNLIIIVAIIISTKTYPNVLAIGALIAMASQLLFQLPFAIKKNYKYSNYINIKDENLKKVMILVLPMLVGVAVGQINTAVDKALASTLGNGPLSALNYASRLNDFVMAMFITSIVTVIYPKLSKLTNKEDQKGFTDTIVTSCNFITLVVLPISIGAIILSKPIVRILFERGQFDSNSTQMTSVALSLYAVGLLAMGIRDVLIRTLYSLSDTKTPMINSSIALIFNIILNLLLIKVLGYAGLAISTSLASIFAIFLLFASLKRKIGDFGGKKIIITFIKSLLASIPMSLIALITYNNIYNILGVGVFNEIISLISAVFLGACIYIVSVILLKVEEINLIKKMLKNFIKR